MFPNKITIKIVNTENKPLRNIAVKIEIFAKHKNNYNLIPPISNEQGVIEVSQRWLIESIERDQSLFVMDYASNLDDCHPKIEVTVMSKNEIEKAMYARNLFSEENDDLIVTANHSYLPASYLIEMQDKEEQIIEIVLNNVSRTN